MINIDDIHERIVRVLTEVNEIYSLLTNVLSSEENSVSFQQIKEVDLLIERLNKKKIECSC